MPIQIQIWWFGLHLKKFETWKLKKVKFFFFTSKFVRLTNSFKGRGRLAPWKTIHFVICFRLQTVVQISQYAKSFSGCKFTLYTWLRGFKICRKESRNLANRNLKITVVNHPTSEWKVKIARSNWLYDVTHLGECMTWNNLVRNTTTNTATYYNTSFTA